MVNLIFIRKFADEKNIKMIQKIASYILIIISFTLASCNSPLSKQTTNDTIPDGTTQNAAECEATDDDVAFTLADGDASPSGSTEAPTQTPPTEKATKAKPSTSNMGGKETLYISTYGANGKVWGHVTMNGNKGRGTIHDDDENSYTITVTRHGGELHGIDQNGREYVFRM